MKNSSHYFEQVEKYLHSANGIKPLQTLEELVKLDGAPNEMVDSVVNGALIDFIFDCIPTLNDFAQLYGPDGKAIYVQKIEMTFDEWIDALIKTIQGINRERICGILGYMCNKGILVKNFSNNYIYRGMAPVRRCPIIV